MRALRAGVEIRGVVSGLGRFTLAITGYLCPKVTPWSSAGPALGAALAIGFAASLVPARRAANLPVLDTIGYE